MGGDASAFELVVEQHWETLLGIVPLLACCWSSFREALPGHCVRAACHQDRSL